jgi:hypothetical protein
MEVDIPVIPNSFAFGTSNGDAGASTSPVAATVQFNALTEVKTFAKPATEDMQRPKHKARRRARPPKIDTSGGVTNGNGAMDSPTKPLSPSKLRKMSEKDRHSRTGRRGMPKKGELEIEFQSANATQIQIFNLCVP